MPSRKMVTKAVQEESKFKVIQGVQRKIRSVLDGIDNAAVQDTFTKIEDKAKIKREHLVAGLIAVLACYLIFGALAQLICNMIGFAYPAYASVKAIRTANKDDDSKWLIYWTVFAFFSLIDHFAEMILSYFPVYYLFKAAFLLYLYLPQTYGAAVLYKLVVDPTVEKIDDMIARNKSD